jgi:heme/copper-type cytochrome/quinol oxidase subunit 4
MATPDTQKTSGLGKDVVVYICMLILAAIQFVIGLQKIDVTQMFARTLVVAAIEAALALLFFMRLWENRGLRWFVLIFTVAVLLGLQYGWTDSYRMLNGAPWSQVK